MTQTLFPLFPEGVQYLNSDIAVKTIKDEVFYFNGAMPIYKHKKSDYKSFRYVSSQLYVLNNVKQSEIVKFFKVSAESVKRWVKVYKKEGAPGFFKTRKGKKRGHILTNEVLIKVQTLLNIGTSLKEIEQELKIKYDTLRKAIEDNRLTRPDIIIEPEKQNEIKLSTQSERNQVDSEAAKGMACTNTQGRIDAIVKKK